MWFFDPRKISLLTRSSSSEQDSDFGLPTIQPHHPAPQPSQDISRRNPGIKSETALFGPAAPSCARFLLIVKIQEEEISFRTFLLVNWYICNYFSVFHACKWIYIMWYVNKIWGIIFLLVNGYITQSESQMSKPDTLCGACPGIILHISQQESVHMLVNWKCKCLSQLNSGAGQSD